MADGCIGLRIGRTVGRWLVIHCDGFLGFLGLSRPVGLLLLASKSLVAMYVSYFIMLSTEKRVWRRQRVKAPVIPRNVEMLYGTR